MRNYIFEITKKFKPDEPENTEITFKKINGKDIKDAQKYLREIYNWSEIDILGIYQEVEVLGKYQ